ncbi:PTS mannose/fructose/sorbose/N-acetylgalactosamine transporter subunit IIC [Lacticaseibacillus rhamnosus]|uniref:PTS mannose/fructose/sorbose/N-acetylgalactosamine transporter subunit IIC n=1 Tax=Lacticaseibacillus rhamnosus TaxID=47715 RepID=UPI0023E259C0|nr:PTS sugar transporter subunit IIC [Lacticaseibacillus rhamnosus]MDF3335692.1 PTS sugar transporter subunit IIC [Lacticaseibacillus rhamnosus]
MGTISAWQILLLTLFAFFQINEIITLGIGFGNPVNAGLFAGLIMGDLQLGLAVGATLQLMILGVGTFGGASIPDYTTGAIVGTAIAYISGKGIQYGIGVAIPVGLLMVQLDILARFTNTYFAHRINRAIDRNDGNAVYRNSLYGAIPWGISRALPVFLMLVFGEAFVKNVLNYAPDWLMGGLKVAGGILPAVGIAILMHYLPMKKFGAYFLFGFVAAAYVKIPMLGVALLGAGFAINQYLKITSTPAAPVAGNGLNPEKAKELGVGEEIVGDEE